MARTQRLAGWLARLGGLGSAAAEMAFYFAVSLVPFLGLTAVAAVSWLPRELGEPLADTLVQVFAPQAGLDAAAIAAWVRSVHSSGWLTLAVLLGAWSAFRFMAAAVRALSSLGGAPPSDWRHRLRSLASALFLVLVWMLALLSLSFCILVAPALEGALSEGGLLGQGAPTAAALSRAMAALVLLLAIALTYRAIPGLEPRGRALWLLSGLATAGWLAAGWAITDLLPRLWRGGSLYGALGSFLVCLLWSYANAWVLLACGLLAEPLRRSSRR